MIEYICPKCKNEAHITQSVRGYYFMYKFDSEKFPIESRYGDDMKYGKYKCSHCSYSSWDLEDMLERVTHND